MATITSSNSVAQKRGTFSKKFNFNYFLQDNVTGSRGLLIWISILASLSFLTLIVQFSNAPARTGWVLGIWTFFVLATVVGELFTLHIPPTRWLLENMFNSVSNVLITLLLSLVLAGVGSGLWEWGVVNATVDPALTHPDVRTFDGASWGVLWGSRKLLLTGLLSPEHNWRVILAVVLIAALWISTFITTREALASNPTVTRIRQATNFLWVFSPFACYVFLAGFDYEAPFIDLGTMLTGVGIVVTTMVVLWFFKVISLNPVSLAAWVLAWPLAYTVWRGLSLWSTNNEVFTPIDPDSWGGLLLTVIFAVFVNILSFPIGVMLALGRRAVVQGIPRWLIWGVAILASSYYFATSTPELWETSRGNIERLVSLWPALILMAAFYFDRTFSGNFLQAFSILFIEIIRGVPLITLLFLAIIMAPFFLPEGSTGIKDFTAVIWGFTIFSAAYMAELVRG
ncbi:MAG: hypothetical protein AAF633_10315, partial [Chloroflexota bacterium]